MRVVIHGQAKVSLAQFVRSLHVYSEAQQFHH